MQSRTRVLIVDGESGFAQSVVWCLAAANCEVHVLSSDPCAVVQASRYVSSFHVRQPGSEGTFAEQISDLARRLRTDICLCVDLRAIRRLASEPAASVASLPCAPLPTVAQFDIASDKWHLATTLREAGLPHPPTALCAATRELGDSLDAMAFPVLLKPRIGGNGGGIRRFLTRRDLSAHASRHPEIAGSHIVQSERPGSDIDCSVLCEHGKVLAFTMQRGLTGSSGFKPPEAIEFVFDARVLDIASRLAETLDWNGVAHIDLRDVGDGRIEIIEVNPRFWGSVLGSLHAGINFPYLACRAGLGHDVAPQPYAHRRYAGGGALLRSWSPFRMLEPHARLRIHETALAHMARDPWPHVVELAAKNAIYASVARRLRERGSEPARVALERSGSPALSSIR